MPACLSEHGDAVWLALKVQPRASRNELVGPLGNELKIKVTAPPVDSAANEAVIEFLSEILRCPRQNLTLLRGKTSTHKIVAIWGLSAGQVVERLGL